MQLTETENHLKRIAACLGIIQGLAWEIMSIICIALYNKEYLNLNPTTYMDSVGSLFYGLYLNDDYGTFDDHILKPNVFTGFMWVYLILSLIWLIVSGYVLKNNESKLDKTLTAWSHATFTISLLDLITVIILGADYSKCLDYSQNNVNIEASCATGILPVLVIAAKGFVLWIVNVVFATIMLKMAKRVKQRSVYPQNALYGSPLPQVQLGHNGYYQYAPAQRPLGPPTPLKPNQLHHQYSQYQQYLQFEQPASPPRRF